MPTAPTANFEKRQPIKPGTYPARCFSVIIMGTYEEEYLGEIKTTQKVRIGWELPTEMVTYNKKKDDGSEEEVTAPAVISQEYTFSMGKKANLRKIVESMTTPLSDEEAGQFDVYDLVGLECMIAVANKEKKDGSGSYAVIQSLTPLMRGYNMPEAVNAPVRFYYKEWDQGVFETLPKFVQEKINQSLERKQPVAGEELIEDKTPF